MPRIVKGTVGPHAVYCVAKAQWFPQQPPLPIGMLDIECIRGANRTGMVQPQGTSKAQSPCPTIAPPLEGDSAPTLVATSSK